MVRAWGICMHGEVVLPVDEVIISGLFTVFMQELLETATVWICTYELLNA